MIRKQWFGFARLFGLGVAWLAVCCEDVCPVLCFSIWSLDHMLQKAENVRSWGQINPNEIEYERAGRVESRDLHFNKHFRKFYAH